jgi:hypothetical protein
MWFPSLEGGEVCSSAPATAYTQLDHLSYDNGYLTIATTFGTDGTIPCEM